jgi:hypothetical protein
MIDTDAGALLAEEFYSQHDVCAQILEKIKENKLPASKLSEVKGILEKLDSILDKLEKEASIPGQNQTIKQARAKGCRTRRSQLVDAVMKEDSKVQHEDGVGFRRTSDLISAELDYTSVEGRRASQIPEHEGLTDDYDDDRRAVEVLDWNVNLERNVMVGACIMFLLALACYVVFKYYR